MGLVILSFGEVSLNENFSVDYRANHGNRLLESVIGIRTASR